MRGSSSPFITGDSFRALADFTFDEDNHFFLPSRVEVGQIVFVKGVYLKFFFLCYHPLIQVPYKLITHNTDVSMPGKDLKYLEDEKIIAWFTQNMDYSHPKLHPIPIGIANKQWSHGNTQLLKDKMAEKKRA